MRKVRLLLPLIIGIHSQIVSGITLRDCALSVAVLTHAPGRDARELIDESQTREMAKAIRSLRDRIASKNPSDHRLSKLGRAVEALTRFGAGWEGLRECNDCYIGSESWLKEILTPEEYRAHLFLMGRDNGLYLSLHPVGLPDHVHTSSMAMDLFGDKVVEALPCLLSVNLQFKAAPRPAGLAGSPNFAWATNIQQLSVVGKEGLEAWAKRGFFSGEHKLEGLRALKVDEAAEREMRRLGLWRTMNAPRLESLTIEGDPSPVLSQLAQNPHLNLRNIRIENTSPTPLPVSEGEGI